MAVKKLAAPVKAAPAAKAAAPAANKLAKMPALPKSPGACVDLFKKWNTDRLAAKKVVDSMEAVEKGIKEHIINTVPKGDAGAVGKGYKGIVYTDDIYTVEDWDKFYAHIKATGSFELLNRALNQAAVKERVEAQTRPTGKRGETWKPKLPPGVTSMKVVKLSVTKL